MEQLVARRAHNPKVVGSSPAPATKKDSDSSKSSGCRQSRHSFNFILKYFGVISEKPLTTIVVHIIYNEIIKWIFSLQKYPFYLQSDLWISP